MLLHVKIWYSQRVGSWSHTYFKENLMSAPCTCHVTNHTTLFSIGFNRLDLIEARQQTAGIIVSDRTA